MAGGHFPLAKKNFRAMAVFVILCPDSTYPEISSGSPGGVSVIDLMADWLAVC